MTFHAKLNEHVPDTCPQIDKVISSVKNALRDLEGARKYHSDNYTEISARAQDAEYELRDVEDIMEALRTANTRLRSLACEYLGEIERLEKSELVCAAIDEYMRLDIGPEYTRSVDDLWRNVLTLLAARNK